MLTSNEENYNRSKIRWACRRGMLELDKILLEFFDKEFDGMTNDKKSAFVKLLDNNDTDLFSWFIGDNIPPNSGLQDLVLCIRHFYAQETC